MPRKGGPNRVHIWELPLKIHQNGWNMLESIFYSKDPVNNRRNKRQTEMDVGAAKNGDPINTVESTS